MPLNAEQQAKRKGRITGSSAPWIAAGDERRILNEYFRLTDDPRYEPLDFEDEWVVYRGEFGETPSLDWHERKSRMELTRRGEVVIHPTRDYLCTTLDAYCAAASMTIDAKWPNAHRDPEEVLSFYAPQCLVQKACVGCDYCGLLITRADEPPFLAVLPETAAYHEYAERLMGKIDALWQCVVTRTPPVEIVEAPPLTPPERWRSINFDNESDRAAHNWAPEMIEHIGAWAGSYSAAKINEVAREGIKLFLPEDCRSLTYQGVEIKRNRARAVSIKLVAP